MSSIMFVFLTGRDKGKTRIFQQNRVTLGTSETCDLVLPASGVSSTGELVRLPDHIASVKRGEDAIPFLVLKAGDELPFALNGEAISVIAPGETFTLHDGDTLRFGTPGRGTELLFHILRQDIYGLHPVPTNPETTLSSDVAGQVH